MLGPNINVPMAPEDEPKALELAKKAVAMKAKATPRERAYIDALARRYTGNKDDRAAADKAYCGSDAAVARQYPADLDAQTMAAEAAMDLRPWNYWYGDGTPYPGTEEIVSTLEKVLARNPNHPGANHLYIHAVEATKSPERAEAAADRLLKLVPGAGHMVHMPSHIYQRVGRYADAAAANVAAAKADEDYISQCRAQGIYPMAYYPHNVHFLWYATTADGRSKEAIEAARKTAAQVKDEQLDALPLLAAFRVVPMYALARFGRWDEVLAEPVPAEKYVFLRGVSHYVRGLAHLGKGDLDAAERELADVRRIAADKALDYSLFSPNTAAAIFAPAPEVLAGELAAKRKDYDNGDRAPRARGAPRGQPVLHRARGVALPGAAGAGRRPRRGRPRARGRGRLLGGPAQARRERVVALRPGPGAARAGEDGGGGRDPGPVRQGLGARGRDAHVVAVLVTAPRSPASG